MRPFMRRAATVKLGSSLPLDRLQKFRHRVLRSPSRTALRRPSPNLRDAAVAARIADLSRYRSNSRCPDHRSADKVAFEEERYVVFTSSNSMRFANGSLT